MRLTIKFSQDESLVDEACRSEFMALHGAFATDGLNLKSSNKLEDLTPEVRSRLYASGPQASVLSVFAVDMAKIIGGGLVVALGKWVTSRSGRKIKLTVGDKTIEATSVADVERLAQIAKELADE